MKCVHCYWYITNFRIFQWTEIKTTHACVSAHTFFISEKDLEVC